MKSRILLLAATLCLACLPSARAVVQYPMTVTNIAELKSLNVATVQGLEWAGVTTSTSPAVYVLGYYYPGDRGGGMFEWDPNEANSPDDGLYVTTNGWSSGNGRWVRRFAGEVPNVKMWGAKGDIHDGTETLTVVSAAHDDTTNIQNAINALAPVDKASHEGFLPADLLIPAGYYKITDTLVLRTYNKLHGEGVRMSHIVMQYGINKDILHTEEANMAIAANDGHDHYDGVDRIEDLAFEFAPNSDDSDNLWMGTAQNLTNAAIVICEPEEGSEIQNISTTSGGYGIRCFDVGGIDMPFRNVTFTDTAIAGICVEPIPGLSVARGQVSITSISGDHRRDESRSNACLVKFLSYEGPAYIEGINTEGIYGGGVIHHEFPAGASWYDIGNLTIKNGFLNSGNSYANNDAPHAFLVLGNSGIRTTAVTMENIHLISCTNLIRDELSQRDVPAPDASSVGLRQAVVRLPISYEAVNYGTIRSDGVTPTKYSRLVTGGQVIYSFIPAASNTWYRILQPFGANFLSTKATVTSIYESSEFSVNVLYGTAVDAVELNVTRSTKADVLPWAPAVTQVRAGSYYDSSGANYPFTDIYVNRVLNPSGAFDFDSSQITIACPVYDYPNVAATSGQTCLVAPTVAPASIAPSGCTLYQSVTKNLVR